MAYNYITKYTSPNRTAGRQGHKIDKIVIHWWGDPNKSPSFDGVVSWLCNPKAQTSAHYVATGTGRQVACIVNCKDTAWHAGNWNANITSIGIECDPRCRDEDYDVVSDLIVELWKTYGKLPLKRHSDFVITRCCGDWDLVRLKAIAEQKLNPTPVIPNAVPMDSPRTMMAKHDGTGLWNIETGKAVKTFKKGDKLDFVGQIAYNNTTYLQTAYSFKKNKNGVLITDLEEVPAPRPKPKPESMPMPTPEPTVDYNEKNHSLLKTILEKLEWLIDKIKSIFK